MCNVKLKQLTWLEVYRIEGTGSNLEDAVAKFAAGNKWDLVMKADRVTITEQANSHLAEIADPIADFASVDAVLTLADKEYKSESQLRPQPID